MLALKFPDDAIPMRENPGKHPLAILDGPAPTLPEPPRSLGEPGLTLWRSIQSQFRVVDVGGMELLMQACLASDRRKPCAPALMRTAKPFRLGRVCAFIRVSRMSWRRVAFVCRVLRQLGVTVEPIGRMGPPATPRWRGHDAD